MLASNVSCLFLLLLELHLEELALDWLFSSGVGVKFAQSFSQWETRADTRRNVPNPADQIEARKPGLITRFYLELKLPIQDTCHQKPNLSRETVPLKYTLHNHNSLLYSKSGNRSWRLKLNALCAAKNIEEGCRTCRLCIFYTGVRLLYDATHY